MAPSNTKQHRAEVLADYLFPFRGPDGSADAFGVGWDLPPDEPVERLMDLPPRTLAAFADALQEPHDVGLIEVAAKFTLDWLRDNYSPYAIERKKAPAALLTVGNTLPFLTVLDAVLVAVEGGANARFLASCVRNALMDERALEGAGLTGLRIPSIGAIGLPPKQLDVLRGYVLGWLMTYCGITPDATLDERAMVLLGACAASPSRLIAVARERGTLDPDVLAAVLRSPAPVLADGAL